MMTYLILVSLLQKEIHDSWMDNIDWVKVKHQEGGKDDEDNDDDDDDDDEKPLMSEEQKITVYKQMLEFMKAGESVTKALRRLGGGNKGISMSASQRLKAKKQKLREQKSSQKEADPDTTANREDFLKLTGFADQLVQNGDFEVYQSTFEKFSFAVKQAEEKGAASRTVIPEDMDADDALDMFADDLDSKEDNKNTEEKKETDKVVADKPGMLFY